MKYLRNSQAAEPEPEPEPEPIELSVNASEHLLHHRIHGKIYKVYNK